MLNRPRLRIPILAISLVMLVSLTASSTAYAQDTTFIYQGRVTDSENPADGTFDMQFKLFTTATVGTGIQRGGTITNPMVDVDNGIFTVQLNFGAVRAML